MSGRMYGNESRWQSEWERDDGSENSSQYSETSRVSAAQSVDASQRLRTLFNQKLYTDVKFVIAVGPKPRPEVLAHKAILAVGSPEFAALLFAQDQGRGVVSEFQVKDTSYEAFRNVVEYLYTDDVFFENDSLVMETLSAARKYRVDSLAGRCESYIESREVSESNVCAMLQLATAHKMEGLKKRCCEFVQDNTKEVLGSNDFKCSQSSTIRAICRLPRLNLISETELFLGVLGWVEAQSRGTSSKRELFEPILKHIRFLTMPCEDFRDLVQKCPDIFTAEEALNLVMYLSNPVLGKSKLPSWCNKGENRCFRDDLVRPMGNFNLSDDRKVTIALRTIKKQNLSKLTCLLELKCLEGRHSVKGLKLSFGEPVTDRSVIGHMTITVSGVENYTFTEHIRIENSKEIVVKFTRSLLAFAGQMVKISAEANEVRNYSFLQFDEQRSFPEQSPFQCSLGSVPKENRLFFISEVLYRPIAPRVRGPAPMGRGPPPRTVFRGNRRQR